MKFMVNLVLVITLLATACVGLHLYIVEGEMNEIRQAKAYNTEVSHSLEYGVRGLLFAEQTQYIATMAEERASELAYKLDMAASMVSSLEEQLAQATATVEAQCETIKDLIDQNSELQNDNQWMATELKSVKARLVIAERELGEALLSLDETTLELEAAKKRISELMSGVVPLPPEIIQPVIPEPEIIQPESPDVE